MTRYITIYTPDEGKRENYPVTRDSEISCTLMGDTFIKAVFNHPDIIDFKAGSFITHDKRKWSLLKSYKPESIANVDGYKYELKFYAEQHQLQRCRLFWTQGSTREVSFNLTTRLQDFAQLICDNINYFLSTTSDYQYTTWSVGDIPAHLSDKCIYQAFDGVSCWDALTAIANAFEVEWWVEDHWGTRTATLHFGKCENGNAIEFAEGGIVSKMPASKRGDDSKYGTRFYVYGGTQNIPDDYYASQDGGVTNHVSVKRLHLPSGYSYINSKSGLQPNEVIEQVVILDDIFPINTETIDNVTTRTETKDGVVTTYYKIVCVNSSFKPSDKLAESIGAKFLTGSLMGREYSLIYAADFLTTKTFEIVARNEGTGDTSIITPNQYLKPKAGDTFVLTGVKLSDEKIKEAENKLLIAGQTIAQQHSADTEVYECPTDPVYCAHNEHNFQLGQRVTLVGTAFGDGRISRIQGYTKKLWNEYEATYSVGDNARYSRYGALSVIATNLKVETAKQVQSLKNNTGRVDAELKIIANSVGMGSDSLERKVGILVGNDHEMSARDIAEDVLETGTTSFAKDLTGVLEATPEEFTFRPSAGDKSIRDESAVIRRIKGNTTVWEQYVRNGNFAEGTRYSTGVNTTLSNNDDGSINIVNKGTESDGISQQFVSPIPAKHKVLIVMDYKRSSTAVSNVVFYLTKSGSGIYDRSYIYSVSSDSRRVDSAILETTNDTDLILVYPFIRGVAGEYVTMYSYMAIDLTAVFGAGKEPTTYEEFRKYYPDAYYPYCEPELRTMRATAIETVGFNLFNGEYADLIGGKTYYIGGTDIGILTFTPNGTTASEVIELGDDRTYTPLVSGKIYSTGTDVCVHFQHSGIKDGECADYVEHMLEFPEIAKYFPDGMNGIGKVYDEINADNAIQRCGVRAYEDGDENDPNVITDRTNTVYQLAEPIVTPIIEPIQLAYDVEDFGTEQAISPEDSAPFRADIVYQFNAEGRIRDNGRNIDKLELQVNTLDVVTKSIATRFDGEMVRANGLVDGYENPYLLPSSNTTDKSYRLATEQYVEEMINDMVITIINTPV